ncbi:MAG TPA: hypothetical protein VF322_10375 [Gammaproteobacteria bacterium]
MSEQKPSAAGAVALWAWRLANTALLALGVWALWRQTGQLENLNGELLNLIDYLNVIADRLG